MKLDIWPTFPRIAAKKAKEENEVKSRTSKETNRQCVNPDGNRLIKLIHFILFPWLRFTLATCALAISKETTEISIISTENAVMRSHATKLPWHFKNFV